MFPVVFKGSKTEITEDLLYAPPKKYDAKKINEGIQKFWHEELQEKNPSLVRALIKQFGFEFVMCGCLYFPVDLSVR